ncbi:MAG: cyclase family protein [Syntrophobacteria bacterium]
MKHFLDLTHRIEEGMPVFPGDVQPKIEQTMTLGKDICTVQSIRFSNHLGTHLDAPSHFIEGGMTVDQIPLATLIGTAVILDFTDKGEGDVITRADLERHRHRLEPGARVLLKTGWDGNFRPGVFYEDFPCLTVGAAQYLASTRAGLLGMDTPSPSPLDDPGQAIHKILLGAGVVILEAVKNLTMITVDECELIVLPPPFRNFSGAPCRVVAVVED